MYWGVLESTGATINSQHLSRHRCWHALSKLTKCKHFYVFPINICSIECVFTSHYCRTRFDSSSLASAKISLEFAVEITPIISHIGVVFPFMASLSLGHYHSDLLMIWRKRYHFCRYQIQFYSMSSLYGSSVRIYQYDESQSELSALVDSLPVCPGVRRVCSPHSLLVWFITHRQPQLPPY